MEQNKSKSTIELLSINKHNKNKKKNRRKNKLPKLLIGLSKQELSERKIDKERWLPKKDRS